MNSFIRCGILVIVTWVIAMPTASYAGLTRTLQKHEVQRLEDNIKKDPGNVKSRNFLSNHYALKKDWKNVIRVLSPMPEYLPEKQLTLLVTSYLELKDPRSAGALIKTILGKKKITISRGLLLVKIYTLQAKTAPSEEIKIDRVKSAINILKTAQESDPENRKVYDTWLDTLEEFIPHYQYDALVVLEKMRKAEISYRPKHHSLMCRYNYLSGYIKQALNTCKEATQQDEKNPLNWIYLGKSHIAAGEKNRGQRMLASVGKKYSHSEEALWATANMYQESKDLLSAYDFYKKASFHKDAKPRDYLGLAIVAFELKKYEEALKYFRKHCSTSKILDHEFRRASGLLKDKLLWQKRYRSAMQACNN